MTITELTITDLLLRLDEIEGHEQALKTRVDFVRAEAEERIAIELNALAEHRKDKDAIRAAIQEQIIANDGGPYRDKATGHTASLVTTKRPVIADPERVKAALAAIGELNTCLRLDEKQVLTIAKRHDLDGIETTEAVTLRIK